MLDWSACQTGPEARLPGNPAKKSIKNIVSIRSENAHFAFLVECQSLGVKIFDDSLRGRILFDFSVKIETDHVASADLRRELEIFKKPLLLRLLHPLLRHVHDEVNVHSSVVFLEILRSERST